MARHQSRSGDGSPHSESFRTESETSDVESETDISTPEPPSVSVRRRHSRVSLVNKRGLSRGSSIGSSCISDDDGGSRARHTRRKKKPRLGIQLNDMRMAQDWQRNDTSLSDTDGGESTTDPDIESDDISSNSDSDGYAEGTKTQIAFMKDRWER
jgi:hypothetical protein